MIRHIVIWVLALLAAGSGAALAASTGAPALEPVAGVVGPACALDAFCLTTYVDVPAGQALEGLLWYNNDETATFPGLFLACAAPGEPPQLSVATEIASGFRGESLVWSTLEFDEPVRPEQGGLFVYFVFPAQSVRTGEGEGEGPGIGYIVSEDGLEAWISDKGEEWVRFDPECKLALQPVFTATKSMARTLSQVTASKAPEPEPSVAPEFSLNVSPNPFNPQAELRFSLPRTSQVDMTVYDLRGAVVKRWARTEYPAGQHVLVWRGDDQRGHGVPSGVYFARLQAMGQTLTERLVLVR